MNEELFKALGLKVESAKEKAFTQGLLGSIFQAAALSGPQARPVGNLQGLGQIGLAGMGAYESSFDKQLKEALTGLQMQDMLAKRRQQESGRTALQQAYERMFGITPQGALAAPGGQAGPTVQRAEMIGQRQPMSQQELLGLAMNPNIDPEAAKRIVDVVQLTTPKEKETFRAITEAERKSLNLPADIAYQVSSTGKISQVGQGPLVKNIVGGQQGLDYEMKIRSAFAGEPVYKARQEMQSAYGQITDSLRQSSPAGDLAAATKFMKLLDPGSVVRESELYLAMQASGALDRMVNYANLRLSGQKLTPDQRKDFQSLADKLYSTATSTYNQKRNEYAGLAEAYGLDVNRAVGAPAILPETRERAEPRQAPSMSIPTVQEMMQGGVMGGIKIRRIGD
jgi:hypothetical protein